MGNLVDGLTYTDIRPIPESTPKFDPLLGFPNGRKVRVPPQATQQEMQAARVEKVLRDYCVDYYLKVMACKQKNYPFMVKCKHEVHEHSNCEFQDYIMRMKEFERERRLLAREKRKMYREAAAQA